MSETKYGVPPAASPLAAANFLLDAAAADGFGLTHLQLQKLLFFSHGICLAALSRPMIGGGFEAWKFGPVSNQVWMQFKVAGSDAISFRALGEDSDGELFKLELTPNQRRTFGPILMGVWKALGSRDGFSLSAMTHRSGGAWDKARATATDRDPDYYSPPIDDNLIRDEFRSLLQQGANAQVPNVGELPK